MRSDPVRKSGRASVGLILDDGTQSDCVLEWDMGFRQSHTLS